MIERDILLKFIKRCDFNDEKIDQLRNTLSYSEKKLIRKSFELLNSEIYTLGTTQNNVDMIHHCVDFLSVLCNNKKFTEEEVIYNRKRIKKAREALLKYYKELNNDSLLYASNKLDEIILDKGIDLNDLIKLIKVLIDKKEDFNIIKKLLNTNKGVLLTDNNELFDYSFNKAIDCLNNNNPDIYYYISLLKIFYSSKIDKTNYLQIIDNYDETNEFANEIYYILHGKKRNLTPEKILDKYGIITNFQTNNIIIPNSSCNNDLIITLDTENAGVKDDAFNLIKDGNKYILGIHISNPATFIGQNSIIDLQARNNFTNSYFPDQTIPIFPSNYENTFSLEKNTIRPSLSLYITIDNDGNILEYKLENKIIKIDENLEYSDCDDLLNNSNSELSNKLRDMYDVACLLEHKNKHKYDYWEKKENNNIDNKSFNYKSSKITNEFMVLYNYLLAKIACENCIPYVYRTQNDSYLNNLIKKLNIKIDDETKKVINNIYLKSKYTDLPIYHSGLHLPYYSHTSSPLRRYPDLYNHFLLHGLYFKDINYDFNEENHKELVEYFNQRSIELSLMKSEYIRALRLKKD